jgi:hypothetical protein
VPRHRITRASRRRWRIAALVSSVPLAIGGVAGAAFMLNSARDSVVAPITVQALGVSLANPAVGQNVTAGATVVAEHAQTLDYAVLAVRDPTGTVVDFPGTPQWTIGTSQKVYESSRAFIRTGTYTYWFAYRKNGEWTNLSPKATFTVGSTAATTSPSPSVSATPTSSPSATSSLSPSTSSPPAPRPTSATSSPRPFGVPGSWTYTFGDDFSGPVAWGSRWADSSSAEADNGHGNPGNQQLEWNQRANCSTADGVLRLTAKPDSITSPSGRHYNWSSCLLSSSPSYAFRYGYIEIRAQLPGSDGFWPAFWTWQAAGNNQWTETDVFEFYSDNHSRLYLTQHSGAGGSLAYSVPFDPTAGFHTYGADIRPDGIRFYVDGRLVYTAPGVSTGLTNIIIDNFVYSKIPPAAGTTGTMMVDYVRAWRAA